MERCLLINAIFNEFKMHDISVYNSLHVKFIVVEISSTDKKKVQNLNIKRLILHVEIVFNEENDNIIRIKT